MFQQREGQLVLMRLSIRLTARYPRYILVLHVGGLWPSAEREYAGMTVQSYQPRIDLSAYEAAPKQKWRLGVLLALAVLGAFALVWMYDGWFRDIAPGATNEARVSRSD